VHRAVALIAPAPADTLLEIGFGTLILRSHARNKPDWLSNPISRSPDEIGGTRRALHRAGFKRIERHSDVGTSAVFTASDMTSGDK
jgi:hypothetical protein